MKGMNMDDLHGLLLDMAVLFDRICKEKGIPYYMLGGTMLGAVRHKGFIPWDDDMDFGIPREYFPKFIDCAAKVLPERYRLLTVSSSEYACLGIMKLSDTDTVLPEIYAVRSEEQLGVNIDIFPLDYTDSKTSFGSFNFRMRMLFKFQKLLFVNADDRSGLTRYLAHAAQFIFRMKRSTIPSYIDRRMLSRQKRLVGTHVLNLYGAWGFKELIPAEAFGNPVSYEFENQSFLGVSDYDAYLSSLYRDYMKLPPEEKRHVHTVGAYFK